MPKLFDSLRSTRWVIWSSPVLLLVLVLTISTRSTTNAAPRSPVASTSTTSSPPTTTTAPRTTTTTSTTRTTDTSRRTTVAPATTTGVRVPRPSRATAVTGSNFASAPAANASGVALDGSLAANAAPVDVPLRGPGTWSLVASSPIHATLNCAGQDVLVQDLVTVGANTTCQLTLSAPQASTWQLTAQP